MNIPLLSHLVHLIEEILKAEVPVIETAAIQSAKEDPKVQAVTALLEAAQNLKTVVNTNPPQQQ